MDARQTIVAGKAVLGIELGSTRIKAVLIDMENKPKVTRGQGMTLLFINVLKDIYI
jgi:activator of 2-hydroxyglutaryl-CoA dehydratase